MSAAKRVIDLDQAKRLCVAQAAVRRKLIQIEIATLRDGWAGIRGGARQAKGLWPLLLGGSVVLGLAAARQGHRFAGWVPAALAAWRWWRRLRRGF
jgi:hypothetical protein